MFYTIYKVTNHINGKIYIGKHQTQNLDDDYLESGKALKSAIRKYGVSAFSKEILLIFDTEAEMNEKEASLVTEEFVRDGGNYNLCPGGKGGFGYINSTGRNLYGQNGKTPNVAQNFERGREKQRYLRRTDPEWRQRESERKSALLKGRTGTFKGKQHSDETKQKISEKNAVAQRGERNSQFGKRWIHSLDLKQSMKIDKNCELPDGWYEGRKIRF